MSQYYLRYYVLLLVLIFTNQSAMAEQTGDSLDLNFKGTFIIQTPCKISDDKVIDISFGNVGISKVDGVNYSMPIPYTVSCNGMADGDSLHLSVIAEQAVFDQAAMVTSANGLAIKVLQNGQPMKMNEPLSITVDALPKLTAVPIKDPAQELTEQTFTAVATLKADYE